MIHIEEQRLPPRVRAVLTRWQREIDRLPDYAAQVEAARRTWKQRNIRSNNTFRVVRKTQTDMCSGARRCCYCEDSYADEVEHMRPKSLYPEQTYQWQNHLYICGPCNGPKNNQFAVFAAASGAFTVVTRKRSDPIVPPVAGDPRAREHAAPLRVGRDEAPRRETNGSRSSIRGRAGSVVLVACPCARRELS